MNETRHEEAFSFIKTSNPNIYVIEKDRYNALFPLLFLTEADVMLFMQSGHKTVIKNERGEVIMQNFESKGKQTYDLTNVHELLTEVETAYTTKEQLLADIDIALAEGNRDLFIELTNQLKEVS